MRARSHDDFVALIFRQTKGRQYAGFVFRPVTTHFTITAFVAAWLACLLDQFIGRAGEGGAWDEERAGAKQRSKQKSVHGGGGAGGLKFANQR